MDVPSVELSHFTKLTPSTTANSAFATNGAASATIRCAYVVIAALLPNTRSTKLVHASPASDSNRRRSKLAEEAAEAWYGTVAVVSSVTSTRRLVGARVGLSVGSEVGVVVGARVGCSVGVDVGPTVGAFVGAIVGAFVGAPVGPTVGNLVGAMVGAIVGMTVKRRESQL